MDTIFFYTAMLAAAMLLSGSYQSANAQAKGGSNAGSVATSHMNDKSEDNSAVQWFADPERGWLRAEGRQDLRKNSSSKDQSGQQKKQEQGNRKAIWN